MSLATLKIGIEFHKNHGDAHKRFENMSQVNLKDHIVICGWSETAAGIIKQLHAEDIGERRQVVLIDQHLDHSPVDDPFVYFVQGDPTNDETLRRACLESAETAIVLADWSLDDPGLRDAKSTLTTLAIESLNGSVYTVVELMRHENRRHLERAQVDEPICVSDLSQRLLVHASLNHGLSLLFSDILTFGEGSEVYKVAVPPGLAGKSFRNAVQTISDQFESILMALDRDNKILCNPRNEVQLESTDYLFVLAEEYPTALASFGK